MQQTHGERWWEGPHAARVLGSCCFLQESDAQTADLGVPSLYVIYRAAKSSLAVNQQGAPPRQCPWGADRSSVLPRSPSHRLGDTAAATGAGWPAGCSHHLLHWHSSLTTPGACACRICPALGTILFPYTRPDGQAGTQNLSFWG